MTDTPEILRRCAPQNDRAGGSLSQRAVVTQTTANGQTTTATHTLDFSYDASGSPVAVTYDGTIYYYALNLQGDVVAILNSSGSTVVSYAYDAWGYEKSCTGTMASTLGQYNPLRYRGYVYDTETESYYLQSRYYNPTLGRFLNADAFTSTGQGILGNNMYAYCNNPVNCSDPTGHCASCIMNKHNCYVSFATTCEGGSGGGYSSGGLLGGFGNNGPIGKIIDFITNTDEQVVLKAEYFAFYKGQLVIRQNWSFTNGRSGSFGIMFLNSNETDVNVVKHEWGHFAQLVLMGPVNYALSVAIPSITSDPRDPQYYSNPWERTADWLGGVAWKDCEYREGSLVWGLAQFVLGPGTVPAFYIFGK